MTETMGEEELFIYNQGRCSDLYLEGYNLTDSEAQLLETKVEANPNDLESRVTLLGNYLRRHLFSKRIRRIRAEHIVWLVERFPDSAVVGLPMCGVNYQLDSINYKDIAHLWNGLVEASPEKAQILGNAARFFSLEDSNRAIGLLSAAQTLEPLNGKWPERIAFHYDLQMRFVPGDEKRDFAEKALSHYERSYFLDGAAGSQRGLVSCMANFAAWLGYGIKARSYAYDLLVLSDEGENDAYFHASAHDSFCALGLISLREGDIDGAKHYLSLAADAVATVNPRATIYNMLLAEEMFALGEREDVAAYIRRAVMGGGPRTKFAGLMKRLEHEPIMQWKDFGEEQY